MSHSCIISKAKSALEVSEAAAKLADRHVKKILTGGGGGGGQGRGGGRDDEGPYAKTGSLHEHQGGENQSRSFHISQLSLLLDFNAHKMHSFDLDVVLCNFDSIGNNELRACCELGGDI